MKKQKTLYDWLTTHFVVSLRYEENFSLKRSFRVNYAKILVFLTLIFILISTVNFYIFKLVDKIYTDEARKQSKYKEQLYNINLKIDEMEKEIARKDSFIQSLHIMIGEKGAKN